MRAGRIVIRLNRLGNRILTPVAPREAYPQPSPSAKLKFLSDASPPATAAARGSSRFRAPRMAFHSESPRSGTRNSSCTHRQDRVERRRISGHFSTPIQKLSRILGSDAKGDASQCGVPLPAGQFNLRDSFYREQPGSTSQMNTSGPAHGQLPGRTQS